MCIQRSCMLCCRATHVTSSAGSARFGLAARSRGLAAGGWLGRWVPVPGGFVARMVQPRWFACASCEAGALPAGGMHVRYLLHAFSVLVVGPMWLLYHFAKSPPVARRGWILGAGKLLEAHLLGKWPPGARRAAGFCVQAQYLRHICC